MTSVKPFSALRQGAVALLLLVAAAPFAAAQTYEPSVGQPGKDVVWVPTGEALVQKMLDMAKVTAKDYVIDLGSGDGRTVIAAAKRGARAHGIEYNPDMVDLAKQRAKEAGVSDKATFEKADLFESDFSKATVITMFLLPSINEKLRPTILKLKPGTRVVSNTFTMGDWREDEKGVVTGDCSNWCTALLWIVPANVQGTWRVGNEDLKLMQEYQMLKGTLGSAQISDAKMNGAQINFTANGVRYTGTVDGKSMKGTKIGGGNNASWTATKR